MILSRYALLCRLVVVLSLLTLVFISGSTLSKTLNDWTMQPEGRMNYGPIRESSGLVASRRFEDVLWTHNDAHNPAQLFAVEEDGKLIREYLIPSATNVDWEDMAWDNEGNLYIFDNASLRDAQGRSFLYVFAEPDPSRDPTVGRVRKIAIRYPDGVFDCEAIFVWNKAVYLVTKPWDGSLPRIYRYADLERDGTAAFVGTVPVHTMVTGADISDDGRRIALCSYVAVMIFETGADPAEKLRSEPLISKLNARQIEGISWDEEELYISNEQRELFEISKGNWEDQNAPFVKTPEVEIPYLKSPPPAAWSLVNWPAGEWLSLKLHDIEAEGKARVAWSSVGIHIGLMIPHNLVLPRFQVEKPGDFQEWFRPGSIYLMVNPDGTRPIAYGENDRCIVLGRDDRGKITAQARVLRPATYVASTELPDWVRVEQEENTILVTLLAEMPGMGRLQGGRQIGFNIVLISQKAELSSWAPLTMRYTWDSPSIWGLLELED